MGSQRVGHDWATELNWTENRRDLISKRMRLHRALKIAAHQPQRHASLQQPESIQARVSSTRFSEKSRRLRIHSENGAKQWGQAGRIPRKARSLSARLAGCSAPSTETCLVSTCTACSLDPAVSILGYETLVILGASLTEERAGNSVQEGTSGGALESPYFFGTAASFTPGNEPLKSQWAEKHSKRKTIHHGPRGLP